MKRKASMCSSSGRDGREPGVDVQALGPTQSRIVTVARGCDSARLASTRELDTGAVFFRAQGTSCFGRP